jgi:hypothetical protein
MILDNLEFPKTPYEWSVFDCFTLANHTRIKLFGDTLPNISWVYNNYTEKSQPKDLVLTVVKQYCQETDRLYTGNLAVLEINGIMNLGTVYQDKIIYMGTNTATYQPIERMATYLNSIWVYDSFGNVESGCKAL